MRNLEHCAYTYRHRQAMKYVLNKIIDDEYLKQKMTPKIESHDIDKLIMYQVMDKAEASAIHKNLAKHHMTNDTPKDWYDKLEAILDYEASGYTKPDKPLNAYDTIMQYRNKGLFVQRCDELLGICKILGINKSYKVSEIDPEGMKLLSQYDTVTEEMIHEEIANYFRNKKGEDV